MVTVHSPPPISSFTVTVNGLTVNVDASASTGYGNLSYAWDWGDGTNGTGMIASHTYAPFISAPTASKDLAAKDRPVWPPHAVFGYTYTVNGTELPGCYVTVTNVRTGEFVVYNETREYWDPNANVYMVDMTEFMLGYAIGDPLNITATKGDLIGWAEGCVSDYGFTQIDVILNQSGSFKMVTITLTVTDMMGRSASVSQTVTLTTPPVDMRTVLYEPFDSYASLDPGWSFWNYSGMDYNHFEVRNDTLFATNAPGLGAIDSRNAYANWTGLISYNETLSISFSIYLPTESDYKQGAWGQWPGLVLYDSSGRLMLFTRWLMDTWSGAPSGWAYIDSTSNWAGVCSFTAGWHQVEIVMNKTMTTWTAVFDGISHPGLSYTGMTSFGFDISKLSFVNGLREETTVVMIDDLLIEVNGPLNATRPVAFFSTSLSYLAVTVDGSGSYDPDGTIVSCEWAFGDGSNATGVNATHTYTAAGTYTIVLTVTDNDGNTAWSRQQVTLVPDLVASFNFTVEGLSVNVDASSSRSAAGIVSYQWDWGDGTTGTGVTASHSYAMPTSASTESQALSEKSRTPPHAIFGLTYAADGVTALPGCIVTITNVRTGEIIVWDETREGWTPTDNIYSIDVAEFVNYGWRFGDILNVNATKGAYIGWAEAPITDNPWGYDQIDVVLYPTNVVVRTVTLTVTDTMGQTSTVSKTVTLYY
jgi:chitodextrinase